LNLFSGSGEAILGGNSLDHDRGASISVFVAWKLTEVFFSGNMRVGDNRSQLLEVTTTVCKLPRLILLIIHSKLKSDLIFSIDRA
jgi:hypothetical protein